MFTNVLAYANQVGTSDYGGIVFASAGKVSIADSTFVGNSAYYGGVVGVYTSSSVVVTVRRSFFSYNAG